MAQKVAHVAPVTDPGSWLDVARFEAALTVLASRDFVVRPVPADGRHHPYSAPCPHCRVELVTA